MNAPPTSQDLVLDEIDVVAPELGSASSEELGGRHPVTREEAVHVHGGCVAWRPGIDDDDTPPRASEHKRCAQTRGTAAHHRHVVAVGLHVHGRMPAPRNAHCRLGPTAASAVVSIVGSTSASERRPTWSSVLAA